MQMGCAYSPLEGWYNCDLFTLSRKVNYINATKRLPIADNTFQNVFTEHFIEHLSLEQGRFFFHEAYRIMKPGGVIRTATPNVQFLFDLYNKKTKSHEKYIEWCTKKYFPKELVHPVNVINNMFYGYGHRFIYDPEFMQEILKECGFKSIRICRPGESLVPYLKNIERHGHSVSEEFNQLETFVIEAEK